MSWMKEHRSERPAIWDYSNPRAEKRVSLRRQLALSEESKTRAEGLASQKAKKAKKNKKKK